MVPRGGNWRKKEKMNTRGKTFTPWKRRIFGGRAIFLVKRMLKEGVSLARDRRRIACVCVCLLFRGRGAAPI